MAFLPLDKFPIGFERAVRELPTVAERPRFTSTGGGSIRDEAGIGGRGRREGAAEEVEDPATSDDKMLSTTS